MPSGVVSLVGRGMGVLDGVRYRRGGSSMGEFGASHYTTGKRVERFLCNSRASCIAYCGCSLFVFTAVTVNGSVHARGITEIDLYCSELLIAIFW